MAAAVGLVMGTIATATPSVAAPGASPQAASAVAERVDSAGAYKDQATGDMVVTVTTAKQAQAVRDAGAVAKMVKYSATDLAKVTDAYQAKVTTPGTSWAVNPVTNKVEVLYDTSVHGAALSELKSVANGFGDAVKVMRTHGTLSTLISGGEAIYGGGSRCSLGFNVNRGGSNHFLTAGHCTNISSTWYGNGGSTFLGYRVHTWFPGRDHGIVQYSSSVSRPGNVYLYNGSYRDITGSGNAFVGQSISRSGSTTGVRSGSVTATGATVNYPQGQVTGLIRTNACAEGGDSGGSMFSGSTALGMTSGGSGNCSTGGTTYFEPVTRPLGYYGASVY
ncbi:MAG: S1 family peptidase [Micromonosporaceae bacterium]